MKVKVWNDNKYPHSESFKGQVIAIEPGGFVEMDFEDAVDFKGQFTAPRLDGNDAPDPRYFKMIRHDWPNAPVVKADPLVCHADGTQAGSAAELAAKLLQFSHLTVKDEAAEKAKVDELDALKAQVARLAALVEGQNAKNGLKRGQNTEVAAG